MFHATGDIAPGPDEDPPATRRPFWRSPAFALPATAIGVTVLFFYRAVFSAEVFISRDIQRVYYPLRTYWVDRVSRGEIPDWFPYDGFGQPFFGMVISGGFHPTNLLYLALPIAQAMKLNILICYPFAQIGTWLCARRWGAGWVAAAFAGIVFAFNGYMISITNNLLYLMAASTFPWAFWAADRYFVRPGALRLLAASALTAGVLFAGDSQSFALCTGGVLVIGLLRAKRTEWKRTLMAALAFVGLTALIGAVQLIPALHVLRQGAPGNQSLSTALTWSTHPVRVLEMLIGPLFGVTGGDIAPWLHETLLSTGMTSLWAESLHLGLAAPVFCGFALWLRRRDWRTWVVAGLAGLCFALMLGKYAGVYALVFKLLPLWRPFRYPEKLFPYFAFLIAIGAASGLERILREAGLQKRCAWVFAGLAALCGAGWLLETSTDFFSTRIVGMASGAPSGTAEVISEAFRSGTFQTASALVLLMAVLLGMTRRASLSPAILVIGLIAFFAADESHYHLTFPYVLDTPPPFATDIARLEHGLGPGKPRVMCKIDEFYFPKDVSASADDRYAMSFASALSPVTPALWGIEGGNTYLPATSHRIMDIQGTGQLWLTRYSGALNVKYWTVAAPLFDKIGGRADVVVAEQESLAQVLIRNPNAMPRVYLASPRCVSGEDESRRIILQGFDPRRGALVECPAPFVKTEPAPVEGTATVATYEPELIRVDVNAPTSAVLVLNDAFYSGWTATIDGHPAPIVPANHAVRGVMIGPGPHVVEFRYRTPGLLAGAWLTATGLLAPLAFAAFSDRKRHRGAEDRRSEAGASSS
ncbi:MAG: YfhO family protein [Myxococcaceae bacterium]|nr:YfhO family protein [Myxococcaceae bacterium]